ncbi:HEPN domain-containing protein [Streptomyces collinus]|uniref:ApeA N-terminal domain 1-containing protein n=1 Tax=Streptomyces collinus TaxID=42684 RepID=UPI00365C0F99
MEARSGVWWVDRGPDKRVAGTLTRSGDVWQLNLVGRLPVDSSRPDGLSLVPPTTIYGTCLGRRYTLRHAYLRQSSGPSRRFDVPQDDLDRADDQYSQLWEGYSLILGESFPESTRYKAATFEISGLSKWWPITYPDPQEDRRALSEVHAISQCEDGWVVKIGVSGTEASDAYSHTISKWATILVERDAGFTLPELEDELMMPLRALISIVTHERAECFNLQLQPASDSYDPTFPIEVDPGVWNREDIRPYGQVTFTPDQVDVQSLVSNWISLARRNIVPVSAAEPSDSRASLQEQVVECVNAAETLHRTLHGEPEGFPFAEKVWEALKNAGGLNRRDREKVRSAVRFVEFPLKNRLEDLASDLGSDFCDWYLQGNTENWALVSSAVRNALSHGYRTSHGIEHDVPSLVGIVKITRSIIALRLLVAAGLPTGAALVDVIKNDRSYLTLMRQSVADWNSLASRIQPT